MTIQNYNKSLNYLSRLRQRPALLVLVLILLGIALLACILFVANQVAISRQQSRFAAIRPVMQDFKTSMQEALGASLMSVHDNNSCYALGQSEAPAPGPSGTLYCGITISGVTNVLRAAGTQPPGFGTAQEIGALLHQSIVRSKIGFTQGTTPNRPDRNDSGYYVDQYYLFANTMDCQLYVDSSIPPASTRSQASIKSGQLYFNLTCQQPASKKFFQLAPSALD